MTNITRRQALKIAAAGALAPLLLNAAVPVDTEIVNVDSFTPDPYGEPSEWHPSTLARVVAAWELQAQQRNRPKLWRRLKYDNAIQWSDGRHGNNPLICWYGIGPASWTADRLDDLTKWLEDVYPSSVLAEERIACGRAFAIVSIGKLSKRLRYELRKPAFARDRTIVV